MRREAGAVIDEPRTVREIVEGDAESDPLARTERAPRRGEFVDIYDFEGKQLLGVVLKVHQPGKPDARLRVAILHSGYGTLGDVPKRVPRGRDEWCWDYLEE